MEPRKSIKDNETFDLLIDERDTLVTTLETLPGEASPLVFAATNAACSAALTALVAIIDLHTAQQIVSAVQPTPMPSPAPQQGDPIHETA